MASPTLLSITKRSAVAKEVPDVADLIGGSSKLLRLSPLYLEYLIEAMLSAVYSVERGHSPRPHTNPFTVYVKTWHESSLAKLSDADIARAWEVADFLMLDRVFITCLADVVVQREVRTAAALVRSSRSLLTAEQRRNGGITLRVRKLELKSLPVAPGARLHSKFDPRVVNQRCRVAATGVKMPADEKEFMLACRFGHVNTIREAHATLKLAKVKQMAKNAIAYGEAAYAGHWSVFNLLEQLRVPYHMAFTAIRFAAERGDLRMVQRLHDDASYSGVDSGCWDWRLYAARKGHRHILEYAQKEGELDSFYIKDELLAWHMPAHIKEWLIEQMDEEDKENLDAAMGDIDSTSGSEDGRWDRDEVARQRDAKRHAALLRRINRLDETGHWSESEGSLDSNDSEDIDKEDGDASEDEDDIDGM
jgi:hypothetical protein